MVGTTGSKVDVAAWTKCGNASCNQCGCGCAVLDPGPVQGWDMSVGAYAWLHMGGDVSTAW